MQRDYLFYQFNLGYGTIRQEPATFNNKGTGIGHDGLDLHHCYREISIINLITYKLFVCI